MKAIFYIILTIISFPIIAQPTNRSEPVLNTQLGTITEYIAPKETRTNTVYLFDSWRNGTVYLKNNRAIKDFTLNYDLERDVLEFNTSGGIKVLPGHQLSKFTLWMPNRDSAVFVNCSFMNPKMVCSGFYEIIEGGTKLQLLKQTKVEILRANFNPITNTGEKVDKPITKEKFFIAYNNAITGLKNNPDFSIFPAKETEMKAYAKGNKLSIKKEEDLAMLIRYYNSL